MDPCKANLNVDPNLVKPIAKGFTKILQIYLFPMQRKKEGEHFKKKPTPYFLKCPLKNMINKVPTNHITHFGLGLYESR
jgi:hypothetical protein